MSENESDIKNTFESVGIAIECNKFEECPIKVGKKIIEENTFNPKDTNSDFSNENVVLNIENDEAVFYIDKGNVMSEIEIDDATTKYNYMVASPVQSQICEEEQSSIDIQELTSSLGYDDDRIDFTQIKKVNVAAFICDKCGKLFSKKIYLKNHSLICRYFKCDKCEKTFKNEFRYLNHMKGHESCKNCGMVFRSKQGLERHSLKCQTFKCSVCDKVFTSQYSLSKHIKTHNYEFKCDKCGKFFHSKKNLAIHIENCGEIFNHTDDTNCNKCKKPIKSLQLSCTNLQCNKCKKPIQNESGIPWLKCNKCEKPIEKIEQINDVAVHLKEHSYNTDFISRDEQSSVIQINKQTTRRKEYKDRKLYRTLQMLDKTLTVFKCEKCRLTFNFQKALIKHMRIYHSDTALTCKLCNNKFKTRRSVAIHIKKVHTANNEA